MVKTYGLTHIALNVADLDRSVDFYKAVFGVTEVYRDEGFVQVQTPGSRDVIVFQTDGKNIGKSGGIQHFGFRMTSENDLPAAIASVEAAGGTIVESGEFAAGEPYLFFRDPDGYEAEIWYEQPTPVDPDR